MTDQAVVSGATKDVYIKGMADMFRQEYPTGSVPMSVFLTPNEIRAFPGIDKDGNGELNVTEFMELVSQAFDRYDRHPRDGFVTEEEWSRGTREINEEEEKSLWSKHWYGILIAVFLAVVVVVFIVSVIHGQRKKHKQRKQGIFP